MTCSSRSGWINLDRKQAWLQFVRYTLGTLSDHKSGRVTSGCCLSNLRAKKINSEPRHRSTSPAVRQRTFVLRPHRCSSGSSNVDAASTRIASLIYSSRDRLRPLIKITETADAVGMSSWCPLPAPASSTSSRCRRRRGQWNTADLLGARLVRHKPVTATPSYVSVLNRIEQEMFPKRANSFSTLHVTLV